MYTDVVVMFCRFLFVLFSSFTLIGCDLEGSQNNQSLEDLYGSWKFQHHTGNSFVYFSETGQTYYDHLESHDCYTTRYYEFQHASNSRLTFRPYNGEETFLDWSMENGVLTFKSSDGITSTFVRSDLHPNATSSCANPDDSGVIHFSINFQSIPQLLALNHTTTEDRHSEFQIYVDFDQNQNGVDDAGDISISITHHKSTGSTPQFIDLNNFNSVVLITVAKEDSYRESAFISKFDYTANQNQFTFQIQKSTHIALSQLTNSSSIRVSTFYKDSSGTNQFDHFPGLNLFTPMGTDLTNMVDNLDDVSIYDGEAESINIDIATISIQFVD